MVDAVVVRTDGAREVGVGPPRSRIPQRMSACRRSTVRSRELFENGAAARGVVPRFVADRAPVNHWMPPHGLLRYAFVPGQIISRQVRRALSRPS